MPSPKEAPTRPIRFVHQGEIREVQGLHPNTTVLQWLREHAHCTGTKEGCAEGDCGACTVVVGERDEASGGWTQRTVNACIQFLPTLDGKALLTIEDLTPSPTAPLHPCQSALLACHGSQCGFCTPGFVMSMWDMYERHPQAPKRSDVADALSGNLCRCTGYRPILDAAAQMYDVPRRAFDPRPWLQKLADMAGTPNQPGAQSWVYAAQETRFHAPANIEDLAQWRVELPTARLLAGGTDMALWVNKQFKDLGDILYIGNVSALKTITPWLAADGQAQGLEIGAAVSLEEAWAALVAHIPHLREIWKRFASPPIRHTGTLGGNIANGSPIGDGAPILLSLGTELVLRRGSQTRQLPLCSFYLDYMKHALQPGEFIQALRVPLPSSEQGDIVRAYKISKRRDSDISALCASFMIRLRHGLIQEARLAWGGMAATAQRATVVEQTLLGQPWNEATLRRAQAALPQAFQPLTDLRATAPYRLTVAANLLERFWLETRTNAPMAAADVQIWPAYP